MIRVSGAGVDARRSRASLRVPLAPRVATRATFRDASGEAIDQGLALHFPAPRSYTGEDVLELHGHGGPAVLRLLLARCTELGARLARPGEFTQRAFLNGKLDLAQAESVADLIDAATTTAARAAARSLSGAFSTEIRALVDALIELRMFVEATLDFPEEDVEFLRAADVRGRIEAIAAQISGSARAGEAGRAAARRARRRARRPAQRRQVEPPEPARRRRRGDRHADRRHDARRGALADRDPRHPAHHRRYRGLAPDRRSDRDARASSARGRRWREPISRWCWSMPPRAATSPRPMRRSSTQLPAALPRLVVHNKIDLAGLPRGRGFPRVARRAHGAARTQRHVFLSAKTGAGVDLLQREILALADVHEDMEDTFLARERHLDALRDAAAPSRVGAGALRRGQAAARARRRGSARGAHGARGDHRRVHVRRPARRDLLALLHRQMTARARCAAHLGHRRTKERATWPGIRRNTSSIRTSGCGPRSISWRASTSPRRATVVDLGCGAGNVTALSRAALARRRASSASTIRKEMLAKARASTVGQPRREWIDADHRELCAGRADRCGLQQCGVALAGRPRAIVPAPLRLGCARRRARRADAGSVCGAVARRGRGRRGERRNGATG